MGSGHQHKQYRKQSPTGHLLTLKGFGAGGRGIAAAVSRQRRCLESESQQCHGSGWSICFGIRPQPAAGVTRNRVQLLGEEASKNQNCHRHILSTAMKSKVRYPSLNHRSWGSGEILISTKWFGCRSWGLGQPNSEEKRHREARIVFHFICNSRFRIVDDFHYYCLSPVRQVG